MINKNVLNVRRKTLYLAVAAALPLLMVGGQAYATCTSSTDSLVTTCSGTISSTVVQTYDAAASYQPTGGDNIYTVNTTGPHANGIGSPYNSAPPDVVIQVGTSLIPANWTGTSTDAAGNDKGLISANYSNSENPAVNNVIVNVASDSSIKVTSNIISSRVHAIVGDSQVNNFTVNNDGVIKATQTYFDATITGNNTHVLSDSALSNILALGAYAAKFTPSGGSAATLNIVSAIYSDDNTNTMTVNNNVLGKIQSAGNFSAGYYGRADTIINNQGDIESLDWKAGDSVTKGHWSIVNFGGANFKPDPQSTNLDTPTNLVDVTTANDGTTVAKAGTIVITDTTTLKIVNSGKIYGDILSLDTIPLNWASNGGSGLNLPAISTSSGPKDSDINNTGEIHGNIYLGSGAHQLNNSGTIEGNITIDQSNSIGKFTVTSGNYSSYLGTPSSAYLYATYAGHRTVDITNSGVINGDLTIRNMTASSLINFNAAVTNEGMAGITGTFTATGSSGATVTVTPQIADGVVVRNGASYQIASAIGSGSVIPTAINATASGLVKWTVDTSGGKLHVDAEVNAANVAGITAQGAKALNSLMTFDSSLGSLIQNTSSSQDVRKASEQLRPEANNASTQAAMSAANQVSSVIGMHQDQVRTASNGNSGVSTGEAAQGLGFWMQGFGFKGDQNQRGGVDGYSASTGGFVFGADKAIGEGDLRLGAALAYGTTTVDGQGTTTANRTNIDSYQGNVYGSWNAGAWYVDAALGYGQHQYKTRRYVALAGANMSGNHDADQYSAKIGVGYPMALGGVTLTPLAALSYVHLDQAGYRETDATNSGAALTIGDTKTDSFRSGLGAKVSLPLSSGTVKTALEAHGIWNHEFADTNQNIVASFVGGTTFTTAGINQARDSANLGLGLSMNSTNGQTLSVNYDADVRSSYVGHTASMKFRYDF